MNVNSALYPFPVIVEFCPSYAVGRASGDLPCIHYTGRFVILFPTIAIRSGYDCSLRILQIVKHRQPRQIRHLPPLVYEFTSGHLRYSPLYAPLCNL